MILLLNYPVHFEHFCFQWQLKSFWIALLLTTGSIFNPEVSLSLEKERHKKNRSTGSNLGLILFLRTFLDVLPQWLCKKEYWKQYWTRGLLVHSQTGENYAGHSSKTRTVVSYQYQIVLHSICNDILSTSRNKDSLRIEEVWLVNLLTDLLLQTSL